MSQTDKPRVIVVGAGGVGVIAALSLYTHGTADVSLVVRSDFDHVSADGYHIDSCDYGLLQGWKPHHLFRTVEDAAKSGTFFDYVVITTKNIPDGPEHSRVENIARPLVLSNNSIDPARTSNILLIQNGIDIEKPLLKEFPQDKYNYSLLSGIEFLGSTKVGKGRISHIGSEKLFVGAFQQEDQRARKAAEEYVAMYHNEGKNHCEVDPRVRHSRWNKLLYNAAINTTTALIGLDVPRALEFGAGAAEGHSSTEFDIIKPAMREVIAIAASEGIVLDPASIDFFTDISRNLMFTPSMCVDSQKGQLMELEVILGNPIRVAKEHNVPTPILSMLYNLLILLQGKLKEANGLLQFDEEACRVVR